MARHPLSVRDSKRPPDEPYEGVPAHLTHPLLHWLEGVFSYRGDHGLDGHLMRSVASYVRIPLKHASQSKMIMEQILAACEHDDIFLDVIDACLAKSHNARQVSKVLEEILVNAGSVWTVAPDGRSLQRRVDDSATKAFQSAAKPGAIGSSELVEAWAACFGRQPNPSDAWDHAIKAVEAVLIPVVVPNQDKAQLGHVLGQLKDHGDQWKFLLAAQQNSTPIGTLVGMLQLMWPNPDRHGGTGSRVPTLPEAQAVVHLAITIVQWVRNEVLSKR